MTITETLSQEAEQPGERLEQSKEHLERLTAREKWIINEHSRGNNRIFFICSAGQVRHRHGRKKFSSICLTFIYLYLSTYDQKKDGFLHLSIKLLLHLIQELTEFEIPLIIKKNQRPKMFRSSSSCDEINYHKRKYD